jgi:hypothetical protein
MSGDGVAWYRWHVSARHAMLETVWNEVGAFMHQQIIWVEIGPVLTYSVFMWAHEPCPFGRIKGQKPEVERLNSRCNRLPVR